MSYKSNSIQVANHSVPIQISLFAQWHHDRNLVAGSDDKSQFAKLVQEVGELSESICKGLCVADDIGDIISVLINIAERNGLTIQECLAHAWEDVKNRKGQMRDGIFIKEEDL